VERDLGKLKMVELGSGGGGETYGKLDVGNWVGRLRLRPNKAVKPTARTGL
jgi:hypothetical protein